MPKLQTTLPEVNKTLFPHGLPQFGVTFITGGAACGKTTLAIDIVQDFVAQDDPSQVIVVTDALETWRHAMTSSRLHVYGALPAHAIADLRPVGLIVMDGSVAISARIIDFSARGPVILTSTGATALTALQQAASVTLQLSKVTVDGLTLARLISGKDVEFFRIVGNALVSRNHVEPVAKSAWERLLDDEDLV